MPSADNSSAAPQQPSKTTKTPEGTKPWREEGDIRDSKGYRPSEKSGPWGPEVQDLIHHVIAAVETPEHPFKNGEFAVEMMVTALKSLQSQLGRGDLKILSRSIRELRYAFKIFKNYRDIRKVTIFGSARTPARDPGYKMAKDFAARIAKKDYMIITGAGPGIMEAGNRGAGAEKSFGVNIRLPYEQYPNPFIANQPTYIDCRYFFTRKLVFVKETSAAAFFPGGFGTLDEAFELLTLVQTGKCDPIPIVLVDVPGGSYWKSLEAFIKKALLKEKKISPEDLRLYRITTSAKEAVDEILHYYSNFHSIRYVGDLLALRLKKPVTDAQLAYLNKNFKDVLVSGAFERSGPLREEMNQPELEQLPRLVFKFNRINNGKLRQIIDYLNNA